MSLNALSSFHLGEERQANVVAWRKETELQSIYNVPESSIMFQKIASADGKCSEILEVMAVCDFPEFDHMIYHIWMCTINIVCTFFFFPQCLTQSDMKDKNIPNPSFWKILYRQTHLYEAGVSHHLLRIDHIHQRFFDGHITDAAHVEPIYVFPPCYAQKYIAYTHAHSMHCLYVLYDQFKLALISSPVFCTKHSDQFSFSFNPSSA